MEEQGNMGTLTYLRCNQQKKQHTEQEVGVDFLRSRLFEGELTIQQLNNSTTVEQQLNNSWTTVEDSPAKSECTEKRNNW